MTLFERIQAYFHMVDPQRAANLRSASTADAAQLLSALEPGAMPRLRGMPLLACTRETFQPVPPFPGLRFVVLSHESPLAAIQEGLNTNEQGFDPTAPLATESEALAFRGGLITNRAFTATLHDQPVAAGMFTPPVDGIAELVGITTLAAYRRQGIGAAITSEIVRVTFAHGVDTALLATDNPVAYRVYRRLGFVPMGMLDVPDA